ncbi:hypothetical protein N0V90_000329 [Kalmusia sp. IMI 367209]|nr:hypothetical protein N0V90_000329 [Kalmusia sp. IMI 367209]
MAPSCSTSTTATDTSIKADPPPLKAFKGIHNGTQQRRNGTAKKVEATARGSDESDIMGEVHAKITSTPTSQSISSDVHTENAKAYKIIPSQSTATNPHKCAFQPLDLDEAMPRNTKTKRKPDTWLVMIRFERIKMMQGPTITVSVGDVSIRDIPKRAAMVVSTTLSKYFTEHPEHSEYKFGYGSLDPGAVNALLVLYLRATCKVFEATEVPFRNTFYENVAILRAARLLGMERYTRSILRYYVKYLYDELPRYDEIVIIEDMATSNKDPLWTKMVNGLTHLQHKQQIPDPEIFAAFLVQHPKLSAAIASANGYFMNKARKQRRAGRKVQGNQASAVRKLGMGGV